MDYRVWISIVLIIGLVLFLGYLYAKGHKGVVKKIILSLVVQAEKALGSKTGELKYAYVVEKVYDKLPFIVTMFFTKAELNNLIESAVNKLKSILSDGATLDSYDDEHLKEHLVDINE